MLVTIKIQIFYNCCNYSRKIKTLSPTRKVKALLQYRNVSCIYKFFSGINIVLTWKYANLKYITEKGILIIEDRYFRLTENHWNVFSITAMEILLLRVMKILPHNEWINTKFSLCSRMMFLITKYLLCLLS